MAASDNVYKAVATLLNSDLGILQNLYPIIKYSNKKFKDFTQGTYNLGDTVNIQLPFRMNAYDGIPANFANTSIQVRWTPLTLDTPFNTAWIVDTTQLVEYPIEQYENGIGKANMAAMATRVESKLASNFVNHTFRAWGNVNRTTGSATMGAPTSYQDLASVYQRMVSFGIPRMDNARVFIANDSQPTVVGSGLNQFVMRRNEEIASSFDIGNFSNMDFHISNLLPVHTAGTIGNANIPTTVVSVDSTGTELTMSTSNGATLKQGDIITLKGANLQFLHFTGYTPSQELVQVRVTQDSTASGAGPGNITANIYPPLIYDATGLNTQRNINLDITTTVSGGGTINAYVMSDHRAGCFLVSEGLYFASPKLMDLSPFATSVQTDVDSGLSVRAAYGCPDFANKQTGYTTDIIMGTTMVDEYAIRLCFPVNSMNGGFY